MLLNKNTKIAIEAAIAAGKEILKIYESGDFDVQLKGDNSPLTKTDLASHHKIVSFLERCPKSMIINQTIINF